MSLPITIDLSSCGTKKGCLAIPYGCQNNSQLQCSSIFTYQVDGDYLLMELLGLVDDIERSYVAIGFSLDQYMGNDSVTECSVAPGSPLQGRLSYNKGTMNYRVNISDVISLFLA
ncbi:unnamed protein product [Dracunculus medinensis]|uniref:Peptidase A1 domain-containing protein n=1 Tax=Dracunculus medinensis TaxID=318479 RepID=A0A0N4UKG5_DRAME|nr:unnamed protein product [Dracunculus medinensis]